MFVIRRRARDKGRIYAADYLHRDDGGMFWVPNSTARARRYATRAEARAALEILDGYRSEIYLFDCIPLEKET